MSRPDPRPTVTLDAAASLAWDAVVIGAGPAGSLAARGLAAAGARTLIIDRADFPRWKVCGCCISAEAARTLERCALPTLLDDLGARRVDVLARVGELGDVAGIQHLRQSL